MMAKAVIVTGAGGVGKTTIAASLAVRAASEGKETLVLTVDPARRLATALGVELGGRPTRHPELPKLWGAMIDGAASWVTVARRHADPAVADRLVNNEFFEAATVHFPASQSYAAAEEASTYIDSLRWDLVVIDTPPAAGGIEFFTAPARMADLVGGRLLRLLTGGRIPGRNTLFNRGARPLLRFADQLLGADLLERVALFLMDLRSTYDGVAKQSKLIEVALPQGGHSWWSRPPTPHRWRRRPDSLASCRKWQLPPVAVDFQSHPARDPGPGPRCHPAPRSNWPKTCNVGAPSRSASETLGWVSRPDSRRPFARFPGWRTAPTDLVGLRSIVDLAEGMPSLW